MKIVLVFVGALIVSAAAGLGVVASLDLPNYGAWTGIRPLEEKLRRLIQVHRRTPVTGLVIGSSIPDYGFSAEALSVRLTELRGTPTVIYNYSTGAAEGITAAKQYRLARLAVRPREVFLVFPFQTPRGDTQPANGPDYALARAPIGDALQSQEALERSFRFWHSPVVRNVAPLRDWLAHGGFQSRAMGHTDVYEMSGHGDMRSFLIAQNGVDPRLAADRGEMLVSFARRRVGAVDDDAVYAKAFFAEGDFSGLSTMRRLIAEDGGRLVVVAFGSVEGLLAQDPVYLELQRRFFRGLALALDADLVDVMGQLRPRPWEIADQVHVNDAAARRFACMVADALERREPARFPNSCFPYAVETMEGPSLDGLSADSRRFNSWSALVLLRRAVPVRGIRARFVQGFAVSRFPRDSLWLALRRPDGSDAMAPARLTGAGTYEADFDLGPAARDQAMILRLMYGTAEDARVLNAPLAGYEWLGADPGSSRH